MIGGTKHTLVYVLVVVVGHVISAWISSASTSAGIIIHVHAVVEALVSLVWNLMTHEITVITTKRSNK